jgi:hypothetical protein
MEISRRLLEASLLGYRFHFDLDLCFRLRETAPVTNLPKQNRSPAFRKRTRQRQLIDVAVGLLLQHGIGPAE